MNSEVRNQNSEVRMQSESGIRREESFRIWRLLQNYKNPPKTGDVSSGVWELGVQEFRSFGEFCFLLSEFGICEAAFYAASFFAADGQASRALSSGAGTPRGPRTEYTP